MPQETHETRAIAHAIARSRYTARILLVLSRDGELTLDQLARKIRLRPGRTSALIHGKLPAFKPANSVLELGLVKRTRRQIGLTFELTELGRRAAMMLKEGKLV